MARIRPHRRRKLPLEALPAPSRGNNTDALVDRAPGGATPPDTAHEATSWPASAFTSVSGVLVAGRPRRREVLREASSMAGLRDQPLRKFSASVQEEPACGPCEPARASRPITATTAPLPQNHPEHRGPSGKPWPTSQFFLPFRLTNSGWVPPPPSGLGQTKWSVVGGRWPVAGGAVLCSWLLLLRIRLRSSGPDARDRTVKSACITNN